MQTYKKLISILWGFYEEKVSPELTIQRNWNYKTQVFKVAAKAAKDKTQKQSKRTKNNLIRCVLAFLNILYENGYHG